MSYNISIVQGNITGATTDAIVNAANATMLGGGGVDGAIHQAAGPELLEHCRKIPAVNGVRCPVGEARITPAGRLRTRWIIHTVGPRYKVDPNPEQLLTSAYRNSLIVAREHDCQSVAFPAISCGVYSYPPAEAAEISVAVCGATEWQDMAIVFYLFSPELTEIWQQVLDRSR